MKPTWAFVGGSPTTGDFYYRCKLPALGLTRRGVRAVATSTMMQIEDGRVVVNADKKGNAFLPDVLVIRQITSVLGPSHNDAMVAIINQARAAGQMVLYDVDGDMWHPPPMAAVRDRFGNRLSVRARKQWAPDENHWRWVAVHEAQMRACSGVIAANETLAKVITERGDMPPVRVVGPSIEFASYHRACRVHRPRRPLRLGWMGTTDSRGPDLSTIVGTLHRVLAGLRGEVEFWHLGHIEDQDPVETILGDDFPVDVQRRPWVDVDELPWLLSNIDIAVGPQVACEWADARSITTGLALAAAGVAAVHHGTENYGAFAHEGGCLIAVGDELWDHVLGTLVRSEELRYRVAGRARKATAAYDCAKVAAGYEALVEVVDVD